MKSKNDYRYLVSKKTILLVVIAFALISCGSSKKMSTSKKPTTSTKAENLRSLESHFNGKISSTIKSIIKKAEEYLGVPYKFGGNSSSGLDCSGLTTIVFQENQYKLPRRSADQATVGKEVKIEEIKPGDLLFFATAGGTRVSHVGIVHTIENDGEIKFIHASTSKGVIISSLNEKYWNKAYLHAQRVL